MQPRLLAFCCTCLATAAFFQPRRRQRQTVAVSALPESELPIALRLKIAKQKVATAGLATTKREAAERELRALELDHPEAAVISAATAQAADKSGFESWKWTQLAEEVSRIKAALVVASAPLGEALPPLEEDLNDGYFLASTNKDAWRERSRALSELQYWAVRGSRKAEAGLLLAVRQHTGNWMGELADQLLRQAWGIHTDVGVNTLMQRAREALKKKDVEAALGGFAAAAERAREVDCGRGFGDAYRWRGLTLSHALGDRAGALEALEMALECSPDNYVVLLDLGKLLATPSDAQDDLERASAAHDHLERAKRLNPALAAEIEQKKLQA